MAKHLARTAIVALAVFLFINTHSCEGRPEEDESSAALVRGSVFCDKCSQHSLHPPTTYFIPGATVAVECSINRKARASIRVEGRTDQAGEFRIELPASNYNTYSGCSVEVINSPDGSCNVPSVGKLTFALNGQRGGVYCAGTLSYRPQEVPSACFVEEEDSEELISYVRGREALESDETSKQTVSPPSLPNLIPPLPPVTIPNAPPLPTVPPLPPTTIPKAPPLPSIPPLPKFSFPPLPNIPLPNTPSFSFNFPPLAFFTPPPPSK